MDLFLFFYFYKNKPFAGLFLYLLKKGTLSTISILHGKSTLHGILAVCASHEPAKPAGIFPPVDAIPLFLQGSRANPEFIDLSAADSPPALFVFPTILWFRVHVFSRFAEEDVCNCTKKYKTLDARRRFALRKRNLAPFLLRTGQLGILLII